MTPETLARLKTNRDWYARQDRQMLGMETDAKRDQRRDHIADLDKQIKAAGQAITEETAKAA